MARFIGATPAQTAVGQIIHDALLDGVPSPRIVERLAAKGLINEAAVSKDSPNAR